MTTSATAPVHGALRDLVSQALTSDPAVAAAAAQAMAAKERVVQAHAAFGPTATLSGTYATSRYREAPLESLRQFRSDQTALQVTQPIFRGGLFAALDAANAQWQQAQAAQLQAESESVQRLLEACFEMMKARDTLHLARAQRVAATEQVRLAKRSFEVGTLPVNAVRDAEARFDLVSAQLTAAEAELSLRQQVLTHLAGREVPEMLQKGLSGGSLPDLPIDSLEQWIRNALTSSPQVQQSRLAVAAADHEVKKANTGHAPTVDLTYTLTRSSDSGTVVSVLSRAGTQSNVGVAINIPLFASGATQAKVRETEALRRKAQADLDGAQRTVSLAIRQAFIASLSAIAQTRAMESAVLSQQAALRTNMRSYELGVKSNFEVLDAQSKLFEARRDLARGRYEAWSQFVRLKSHSGRFDEADISHLDALLVDVREPEVYQPVRVSP